MKGKTLTVFFADQKQGTCLVVLGGGWWVVGGGAWSRGLVGWQEHKLRICFLLRCGLSFGFGAHCAWGRARHDCFLGSVSVSVNDRHDMRGWAWWQRQRRIG